MYSFKCFVSVAAVLVLILAPDDEVTAAPAPEPHPCLWMLDHDKPVTTTTKPDVVEDFARLKNKKTKQFEKLINDWILWGPSSDDGQKPRSSNALDRMISGYLKFLENILDNMF